MSNKSGVSSQIVPLPRGGGALSGIGETFSPDPFTGTGTVTVPLSLPAGRNGLQPQLSLVYSTGNGNGPFGLGWALSIPSITRKTSKGLPHYRDRAPDPARHDTFVLSGAEDLVQIGPRNAQSNVAVFRPRTEGLFAAIEHVLSDDDQINLWRVQSRDGLLSQYGTPVDSGPEPTSSVDPRSVIADPRDPAKVFSWMLSETQDSYGNRIQYSYRRDRQGPPDRDGAGRQWDQLYLEKIRYVDVSDGRFLIAVTFVYDERDRPDPFSSYRSGFEIRTRLRCRRIEIHSGFGELPLRTYELTYADEALPSRDRPVNGVSLLHRVELVGHDGKARQSLPPLDFSYTGFGGGPKAFQPLSASTGALPKVSLAAADHELIDLYGRGLPDLVEMNGSIRFWRNQGGAGFAGAATMDDGPRDVRLNEPGVQFADVNGDGRTDLLVTERDGYFPLRFGGEFFEQLFVDTKLPLFELEGSNTRFLDLDGDGVVDALRTEADFRLFFNRAELREWDVEERSRGPVDANLRFENPQVKLADLSGDGLQDFVFVDRGTDGRVNVRYWPNLGDGRFGDAIDMGTGPQISDNTAPPSLGFEPTRLLMADADGDGLDDILYIHLQEQSLFIWINQGGNAWSHDPIEIPVPANVNFEGPDAVRLVDMLGTGTAGILWTADRRPGAEENYQFLDLAGAQKPYLLSEMNNHLGTVTRIQYAPSTKFYLADQERQAHWRTPLPFPVHVVDRVEVIDELSKGKLTTEYRYHHGYWDGTERELRGFGMVEQLDTEVRVEFNAVGLHGDAHDFDRVDDSQFSPPVLTKTWFHLGDIDDETLATTGEFPEIDFSGEYFEGDPPLLFRSDEQVEMLEGLPDHTARREALRTLRGTPLRTELWAPEGSARPFTVAETLVGLTEVDEQAAKRRRVFFPHQLAQRTTKWEGGNDPMTSFGFTEDYDEFGQPRRHTQIACPRGWRGHDDRPGTPYLATQTRSHFARPTTPDAFILDRLSRSTSFEIVNDGSKTLLETKKDGDSGKALAIVGQALNFYDGEAFVGLSNGDVGTHGALVRTETLVLTESILKKAYEPETSDGPAIPPYLNPDGPIQWTDEYPAEFRKQIESLPHTAGFIFHGGDAIHEKGYFASSARNQYDFQVPGVSSPRGLLRAVRDPLARDPAPGDPVAHDTTIEYDGFELLPIKITDPVGLVSEARYDPRVLQLFEVTDPNGNRKQYTYTPLGLLKDMAVLGKAGEFTGDEERLPNGESHVVPSTEFQYDLLAFVKSGPDARVPASTHTIRRVHHISETDVEDPAEREKTVETVEYSDGFGRLLQTRTLAEDDTAGDPVFGGGVVSADQAVDPGDIALRARVGTEPNVIVSGAQIYDNKGRVIEKFEPYFELESGFAYRAPGKERFGQKVTMFYDAIGRLIRTVNPDGSEQRVIYGVPGSIGNPDLTNPVEFEPTPWESYTYDANDLAPISQAPSPDATLGPLLTTRAPRHHHFTPSSILVDALGRTILAVARNRNVPDGDDSSLPLGSIETRTTFDIRGNIVEVVDALKRKAYQYVYDLTNSALRSQNIDAGVRRVVLDGGGNDVEGRDSKGSLSLRAYDRLHRLTRLWARDDDESDVTLRERLEYGDQGDPALNRSFNRLGVLHRHYDEAGLLEIAAYDFKGNILERSRRGIRDEAILAVFPNHTDRDLDWNIHAFRVNWDPLEEQEQRLLAEQLHSVSMSYDALNRVKTLLYPRDMEDRRRLLRPTYNRAGALESVTLDDKPFVEHIAYDAKGQRTIVALGNRVMTLYAYDPRTLRLARMFTTRFTSNGERKFRPEPLTSPEARKKNLHQDFGYEYDLVGNIVRIRDRTPESGILNTVLGGDALDRVFEYDALYRLSVAAGREVDRPPDQRENGPFDPRPRGTDFTKARAYRERYRYDALGNLEDLNHSTSRGRSDETAFSRSFEHLSGTNHLKAMTSGGVTFVYAYDKNGNLTDEDASRHFEWDHGGRMKAFRNQVRGADAEDERDLAEPTVYVHNLYDASGLRVKKLVRKQNGLTEVTDYVDGLFEHHRWQREGDEPKANNRILVIDDQQRIACIRVGDIHPEDGGPDVQYQFGDHLGSSNVVISADGKFVNHEEYTPYGETSFGSFARKRYRFTGKERDEESGLTYHSARHYASWLCRWTTCDPVGPRDGPSLYVYALGNPLGFVDPSGTQAQQHGSFEHENLSVNRQAELSLSFGERLERFREYARQRLHNAVASGDDLTELYSEDLKKKYFTESERKAIVAYAGANDVAPVEFIEGRITAESRVAQLKLYVENTGNARLGVSFFLRPSEAERVLDVAERARDTQIAIEASRARTYRQFAQGQYRFGLSHVAIAGAATSEVLQAFGVQEEKAEAVGQLTSSAAGLAGGGRGSGGGTAGRGGGGGGRGNKRRAREIRRWLERADPIPGRVSKPERDKDPRPGIIRRRPVEPATTPPRDPPKHGPYR